MFRNLFHLRLSRNSLSTAATTRLEVVPIHTPACRNGAVARLGCRSSSQLEFFRVFLDFYMHEDLLQSQGDDLQQLHDNIYQDYQFVSSFNSVSDRFARKVLKTVRT